MALSSRWILSKLSIKSILVHHSDSIAALIPEMALQALPIIVFTA